VASNGPRSSNLSGFIEITSITLTAGANYVISGKVSVNGTADVICGLMSNVAGGSATALDVSGATVGGDTATITLMAGISFASSASDTTIHMFCNPDLSPGFNYLTPVLSAIQVTNLTNQ
jgi:hypothetical protein